jgi:hypothetical protein
MIMFLTVRLKNKPKLLTAFKNLSDKHVAPQDTRSDNALTFSNVPSGSAYSISF